MPKITKPPVKAACLACRSSKTRCDGQQPCKSCSGKGRVCNYQPSRRGGPRTGARYEEAQQRRSNGDPPLECLPSEMIDGFDPFLENMMGLVTPFAGVHNLDLPPDTSSDAIENRQNWDLPTPSDGPFSTSLASNTEGISIRAYQNEDEIINAYYVFIHPYLPLLPSSIVPHREDQPSHFHPPCESDPRKNDLPYWPESSLGLALSSIFVLIPPSQDESQINESNFSLRRSYAQLFAQSALATIEKEIDDLCPSSNLRPGDITQRTSSIHPDLPIQLDPILALVVLAIYEYVQRGNISRMRARINQAVTTAMDISLHALGESPEESSEAQRRAWWITMFVAYLSSNVHLSPPVIACDDMRITTPYPRFDVHLEPWGLMMQAQMILFASHQMAQKIESSVDSARPPNIGTQITELDNSIVSLMTQSDRCLRTHFGSDYEEPIAENMWRLSRILIYTARVRLHRFRAFMDIPLFLEKYCDLASINSRGLSSAPSPVWVAERESTFPFTEQESSKICLKAALVVATCFRQLPYLVPSGLGACERIMTRKWPHTIPYFVCCAMQSSYTLLMLLHKLRACLATDRLANCYHLLDKPEPTSEISDAERLAEELRHAVKSLGVSLKSDIIFEGVGDMGREIESAYLAAYPECLAI